ncbi:MAG TPA: peptidoglycan recognition family protein, partial [Tepidisphaeraceae bacterium]|nr:peptidoglycan recognition family protein [Tepidisphaeraceae bacterium]
MAKWCALLCVALLAGAGCQQQKPATVVDNLPEPNFGGPVFAEKPAPSPALPPVAVAPHVRQPVRPEPSQGSIPAAWIPRAQPNQWYWIVIHHSATPDGGAARFNKMHQAKGWDELGYHFVIGNGTDTRDGQIEVGPRWPKQKWGAHDKTPGNEYNLHGIGICLVGNFDVTHPTQAQIKSLERLVTYLMKTYHIPADHVLGHGETKPTDCPGRYMNVAMIRRACAQMVASSEGQYHAD